MQVTNNAHWTCTNGAGTSVSACSLCVQWKEQITLEHFLLRVCYFFAKIFDEKVWPVVMPFWVVRGNLSLAEAVSVWWTLSNSIFHPVTCIDVIQTWCCVEADQPLELNEIPKYDSQENITRPTLNATNTANLEHLQPAVWLTLANIEQLDQEAGRGEIDSNTVPTWVNPQFRALVQGRTNVSANGSLLCTSGQFQLIVSWFVA